MSRHSHEIEASSQLKHVRYEIRGKLARRAHELERQGYEIIQLNIGNPGLFGLRTPETMRLAMIENLPSAEAYCNQKGIFPAREAVVMQQQARGIDGVDADHVFMGNGVSELIDLTLRGALEPRRRGADSEPRLSALDGGDGAERRPRRVLPVPGVARLQSRPRRRREAHHAAHARDRHHQSEQSDGRRLQPRAAHGARAARGTAQPRRHERRDLRPDALRRRGVRADGHAVPRHVVRDVQRPLEDLSRVRLSRRLGVVQRRRRSLGALHERARSAGGAAPLQQRAGPVGRADGARRLPEHRQALLAGRQALSIARRPSSTASRRAGT